MSQFNEPSRREASAAVQLDPDDARYDDPDLPPVLSQRRPATSAGTTPENPTRDEVHDTIPAPAWFVEE
jgi:hypothetical protein